MHMKTSLFKEFLQKCSTVYMDQGFLTVHMVSDPTKVRMHTKKAIRQVMKA